MNRRFAIPLTSGGGLLTGNQRYAVGCPFDCVLTDVSAVGSNIHGATVKIGDNGDDDKYLPDKALGDNNQANLYGYDDFATEGNPRFRKGDTFVVLLSFGGAGTAVLDPTIILYMTEG